MSAVQETREPSARFLVEVQPALVRQFELLAKAPGGVARLRDLILTLAVQGKLVKQDPSAESADQLLARVHAAKRELLSMGRIGKQKPTEPINEDETAFPLPQGWAWCRVGDLAWPQAGFAFKSTGFNEVGQGLPLIRIRDVGSTEEPTTFFSGEFRPEFVVEKGDWLISMDGEFRVRQWHAATALLNQRVTRLVFIVDELHADFIATALQRELTALQGTKAYTTVDHLSGKQIAEAVIALPPATEQARIVSRVDELMQLCNALEGKGRLEAQQHARLLETLLGTLTDSTTPEELAANWQRVAEHFDLLLDRPEAVDVLEQTVLQLAVRGLLVPQDPREEPGIVLLEQIQAAKAAGPTNSKNHRVRAELPEVGEHERPFEPPPGWVWTRFGEVTHVSGGVTLGRKGAIAKPLSLPYLRVANVQRWKLAMESLKDVVIDESELPRYQLVNGDLLITEGGDWDKVGRTSIWRGELPICLHQNHVFKARGYISAWHPGWAELYLNLDIARAYFAASAKQTTNLASINMTELRHCAFPLPPRAEQDRILARATELRKLCADLRRRLAASQATQSQLAEALIDSATA